MGFDTPARLRCYFQDPDFPDFRRVQRNFMGTLVRIQPKGQMTIPRRVRSAVGLIDGDLLEVRAVGKRIVIVLQRRIINARLDEAEKGPFHGPFKDGAEVAAFLKKKIRRTAKAAKSRKLG